MASGWEPFTLTTPWPARPLHMPRRVLMTKIGDQQSLRAGQAHDLIPSPMDTRDGLTGKYRCNGCGESYQVRTSAPSCRVRLLEQMQQVGAPYGNLAPAARRALMEVLVRRKFKWPKPFR